MAINFIGDRYFCNPTAVAKPCFLQLLTTINREVWIGWGRVKVGLRSAEADKPASYG